MDNFQTQKKEIEVLRVEKTKKTNKIAKTIIITIIIIISLFTGNIIYSKYKNNKKLTRKMENASLKYFDKYQSTNDSKSTYTITLKMLKKANDKNENYNLKGLDKCNIEKTLSKITIDYNNGKPKKVEVELKC